MVQMKLKQALTTVLATAFCAFAGGVMAAPITFTYNCTIDGAKAGGVGTNGCAGGPIIGQVRISESAFVYGGSDVLLVEARLQFVDPDPPGDLDPLGYQLDAVWLNIKEALLGSSVGDNGIAWKDGSGNNDYNYIWFARDSAFTDGRTAIQTVAQSTEASSWKNFDLSLCDSGQSPADCKLDLPVLLSSAEDPAAQVWVTLGFLNSGTLYDLKPEDFNFKTTNTADPGTLTYGPACEPLGGELLSAIKVSPRATSGLFDNCVTDNYGPRYGAAYVGGIPPEPDVIPEPESLLLVGVGLIGLAISRRKARL
jgi:hypothetical protein